MHGDFPHASDLVFEMQPFVFSHSDASLILVYHCLFAYSTVTFTFALSTLFSKAKVASIAGPLLFFIALC